MRKAMIIGNCTIVSAVITLALAALSCLYLMARSSGEVFHDTALFGAVFFESKKKGNGALSVGAGVENYLPLIGIFVLVLLLTVATFMCYRWLRAYRAELLSSRAANDPD